MELVLQNLLREYGIEPVLVDVGASGGPPDIWRPIAEFSTYIGFDPDLREIKHDAAGGYRSGVIINKALSPDPLAQTATFHLTRSPYCSSMLEPDSASLKKYSFWELFEVERTTAVPATTLMKVLTEQSLERIDWLKVDAQGVDLRLYQSLDDRVRSRVLAVDTEPGLIDAYCGEDLFVDVHRQLKKEGYWLSNLNVLGVPRISKAAMGALGIQTHNGLPVGLGLRSSPGWCEARYLRTAEWIIDHAHGLREMVLAWAFAMLDRQYGHALDLAAAGKTRLKDTHLNETLWNVAAECFRAEHSPAAAHRPSALPYRVARKIGQLGRRILGL